ncbi:MAG TPA: CapA family protein, partial [Polyangiaceae bacterium]|nr:CapA family protein [Polyangiaceae bacterium]
ALPQVVHGAAALGFTHERHALYRGISHGAFAFVDEVWRHLLLGEEPRVLPISGWILALFALPPAIGVARLPPATRRAVLFACGLPLVAAFILSLGSEVEPRYLAFALPGLAVLGALGAARFPRWAGPLAAAALMTISVVATARAYGPPPSDWPKAGAELDRTRRPGDVIAVFPAYWAETLRFYTTARELVPILYPRDLERVLARGHRVLLVRNEGRYAGDLDAYLDAYTEHELLFDTSVRDTFAVETVRATARLASVPDRNPSSVVFTGLVGSGGYAWTTEPNAGAAFAGLEPLFASGGLTVSGYAPCEPPWPARLLLGPELSARLLPNRLVAEALRTAGVRAVVVAGALGDAESADAVLAAARLAALPSARRERSPPPVTYVVGTERVALLSLGSSPADAGDSAPSAVRAARAELRPNDGLVVFVPLPPTLDALPSDAERAFARKLVDAGADVVVGLGSYVARPVEQYRRGLIAYSLGATLLPPNLDHVAREATGVALRVQFDGGRPLHCDVLPLVVDDEARPHLGRFDTVPASVATSFEPFARAFPLARVTSSRGTESEALRYESTPPVSAVETLVEREVRRFVPWSPPDTSLRPFAARFGRGKSFAGFRGVSSLGVPRAAIELDAAPESSLALEFPPLVLGRRLSFTAGVPDDREQSKYRPFFDENVSVSVEGGPALDATVAFHGGWQRAVLDTAALAGAERRVTVVLSAPGTHFPVAFTLGIEP